MTNRKIMEKLLNGFEVEWKLLGEVASIKTGASISKQEISDNRGNYPVINSGLEPLGFINRWNTDNDPIGITSRGAGVGSVIWTEGKYFRGNLNYSVTVMNNEYIDVRYLYHLLNELQPDIHSICTYVGIPALNIGNLKNLPIPIPPIGVQTQIVYVLDAFTEVTSDVTSELTSELKDRNKQYNYYRDKLFHFDESVQHLPMGDSRVGKFIRGSGLQKKDFTETGIGCIHYGQIYTYYGTYTDKTKTFVSEEFAKKARKAKKGDLIIATTSENDEDVCKAVAWLGNDEIAVSSDACFYTHNLNPKYVAYYFQTEKFQKKKNRFITGVKVRRVNARDLEKIEIPFPSLAEQERIVSILDKFDTLISTLGEGLPREIELRQKQYEYYRNLLLSFPEEKVEK